MFGVDSTRYVMSHGSQAYFKADPFCRGYRCGSPSDLLLKSPLDEILVGDMRIGHPSDPCARVRFLKSNLFLNLVRSLIAACPRHGE